MSRGIERTSYVLKLCPSRLAKASGEELGLLWWRLTISLTVGRLPLVLKKAYAWPRLNKSTLDVDNLMNYRSVSYLSF